MLPQSLFVPTSVLRCRIMCTASEYQPQYVLALKYDSILLRKFSYSFRLQNYRKPSATSTFYYVLQCQPLLTWFWPYRKVYCRDPLLFTLSISFSVTFSCFHACHIHLSRSATIAMFFNISIICSCLKVPFNGFSRATISSFWIRTLSAALQPAGLLRCDFFVWSHLEKRRRAAPSIIASTSRYSCKGRAPQSRCALQYRSCFFPFLSLTMDLLAPCGAPVIFAEQRCTQDVSKLYLYIAGSANSARCGVT